LSTLTLNTSKLNHNHEIDIVDLIPFNEEEQKHYSKYGPTPAKKIPLPQRRAPIPTRYWAGRIGRIQL